VVPLPPLLSVASVRRSTAARAVGLRSRTHTERGARDALSPVLAALRRPVEAPRFWPLSKRLVEGLLLEAEPERVRTPPQSVQQLKALHRRIIEPRHG